MAIEPKTHPSRIERELERFYTAAAPSAEFAARLGAKLESRAEEVGAHPSRRVDWRALWSYALGGAGVALLIGFFVFAISVVPQRRLALPQVGATLTAGAASPISGTLPAEALIPTVTPTQVALPTPTPVTYEVASGDTCSSIAFKFGVAVVEFRQLNGIGEACEDLIAGQAVLIPQKVAPTLEPGEAPYVISRTGGQQVNLRAGPGTDYPVVGTISGEERLQLETGEPRSEWVPVTYPGAEEGVAWAFAQLVIVVEAPAQQEALATSPIEMRASNPRRDGDSLLVDFCFELPDDRDWMVANAVLETVREGKVVESPVVAAGLISLELPEGVPAEHRRERCDVLEFSLQGDMDVISPTLKVLALEAYPREGQTCEVYLEQVQPLLDEQQAGIRLACEEVPGGTSLTIPARPEGMSEAGAQEAVSKAFRELITIQGPWSFSLEAPGGTVPALEEQQPLLAELRALKALRIQAFFPKGGWLHLLSREVYAEANTTPDGATLPLEYQTDEWFYFDDAGRIARSVTRTLDGSGAVLYRLESGKEMSMNLDAQSEPPSMDYGFTDLALSRVKTGGSLRREPVNADGEYVGERYVLEDGDWRWEAMYEPDTGKPISVLTWQVIPEGLKLWHSVVVLVMEQMNELPEGVGG